MLTLARRDQRYDCFERQREPNYRTAMTITRVRTARLLRGNGTVNASVSSIFRLPAYNVR